jgi:hypothetical protein
VVRGHGRGRRPSGQVRVAQVGRRCGHGRVVAVAVLVVRSRLVL